MAGRVSEGGVGGQGVFLGVVEVCRGGVGDARVGFQGGDVAGAEVEGVVFCAGLEEDVARGDGGEGEGGEEVGEEGCWRVLVWMVRWREGGGVLLMVARSVALDQRSRGSPLGGGCLYEK